MAFTIEEETVLKLLVASMKAKAKLNKVNVAMGTEIRSAFSIIDAEKREEYRPQYEPLEAEVAVTKANLQGECEK